MGENSADSTIPDTGPSLKAARKGADGLKMGEIRGRRVSCRGAAIGYKIDPELSALKCTHPTQIYRCGKLRNVFNTISSLF